MSIYVESVLNGKIIEWDSQKGYGFLQAGKQRVFLHWRDFAEHHKRAAVGDRIRFSLGKDVGGRICAKNAVHANDGGHITVLAALFMAALLVLPLVAAYRLGARPVWVSGYAVAMSALSYWCYALDKRWARLKERRLAEGRLHLLELLGGWPGAFLAQRRLRHKCAKRSYQFVFWAIVLLYQFAALDSLWNWQLSRVAWKYVERTSQHRR